MGARPAADTGLRMRGQRQKLQRAQQPHQQPDTAAQRRPQRCRVPRKERRQRGPGKAVNPQHDHEDEQTGQAIAAEQLSQINNFH